MNINMIQQTPSVALADAARIMKANGNEIIELQTGDPDFPTPSVIVDAGIRALKEGHTHYSFSAGLPYLRNLLADSINREFGTDFGMENVLVTHGAAQGIASVISAIIEYNDEAIVLEPNWTTVDSLVAIAGGKLVKVSHCVDDDFLIRSLNSCRTDRTKLLCFNSPNNPTGSVFSAERVKKLVGWAEHHGIYILSDEVYRSIVFDDKHHSVLEYIDSYDRIIYVDSFSKRYSMTGWRIGFVLADKYLLTSIAKASQIMITNVAPFTQYAAIAALESPIALKASVEMCNEYRRRLEILLLDFKINNLLTIKPRGAFYVFIKVTEDDKKFAEILLKEELVCAVPGGAYGVSGTGWLRVTFAAPLDAVREGVGRIAKLMQRLEIQ